MQLGKGTSDQAWLMRPQMVTLEMKYIRQGNLGEKGAKCVQLFLLAYFVELLHSIFSWLLAEIIHTNLC